MRPHLLALVIIGVTLFGLCGAAAAESRFELGVRTDRFHGRSTGTLIFSDEGIEYRTSVRKYARQWRYEDVKQLQIASPTSVKVLTYEDGGVVHFGKDRVFDFKVIQSLVSPELVAFLVDRVERPVVTAVLPPAVGEPQFRVSVKHQRQRNGTEGTLAMYDTHLRYITDEAEDSRYWRFGDIVSVQKLDRFRLEVRVYEGGSGTTRPFVFQLKTDLAREFYDALWARVNPSPLDLSKSQSVNGVTATTRD